MRKKILLVDDSITALTLERALLRDQPYDLLVAHDGREAVAVALDTRPDLIVMDIVMPELDGFAACQELRAREETRAIPVIMVTTLGQAISREAGFVSGCSDYVTKPINSLELLTKIRDCLGA